MLTLTRRLLKVYLPLTVLMLALLLIASGSAIAASGNGKGASAVVSNDPDDIEFAKEAQPGQYEAHAPGLNITVLRVKIKKDRRPVVLFTATDERGETVGKQEMTEVRFLLAFLEAGLNGSTSRYVSYNTRIEDPDQTPNSGDEQVQATYDSALMAGLKQRKDGVFLYKFATVLPEGYDITASHMVGGQARRTFLSDGVSYPANTEFAFRPDGGQVVERRDVVATESCNNCHTRLSVHGEIRRDVQLCILCHTPQSTDAQSGNTVDFPVMIHKIHMGEELPSVVGGTHYEIIGYGNSVNDYSEVVFPQDIRNCEVCHASTGAGKSGSDDYHLMNPTMAGCGSCHDRTWFDLDLPTPDGYTDHAAGVALTDDSTCVLCHRPEGEGVAPIVESHLLPTETAAAVGLKSEITGYEILTPDTTPQLKIYFTVANGDDTPIADMNTNALITTFRAMIAYPAPDYTTRNQNTIKGTGSSGTLANLGGGAYSYIFNASDDTLPLGSTATFVVAIEARRSISVDGVTYSQGIEQCPRLVFTLDGSDPNDRRVVIDQESCNKCHGEIRAHGGSRVGVEYCVICHNTTLNDDSNRPTGTDSQSFNFKDMLHKLHRGEDAENGFAFYGRSGLNTEFAEVRFPGDLSQCTICHVEGGADLPVSADALPTLNTDGGVTRGNFLPERAACTSCHDSVAANLHAVLNSDTVNGIESCEVCHGVDARYSVESVHQQTP